MDCTGVSHDGRRPSVTPDLALRSSEQRADDLLENADGRVEDAVLGGLETRVGVGKEKAPAGGAPHRLVLRYPAGAKNIAFAPWAPDVSRAACRFVPGLGPRNAAEPRRASCSLWNLLLPWHPAFLQGRIRRFGRDNPRFPAVETKPELAFVGRRFHSFLIRDVP